MTDHDPRHPDGARVAEAARIRRRWINLGELLTVVAVLISGLTFWNSYRERTHGEEQAARAEHKAVVAAGAIALGGAADAKGQTLTLTALRDDQRIQGQTIGFPPALHVGAVDTTGEARIETAWFEKALKQARQAAGAKTETAGDLRLPVVITTRFLVDEAVRTSRAYYDIGYRIEHGGLFGGSNVRMTGLSLIGPAPATANPARLDALWRARGGAKG